MAEAGEIALLLLDVDGVLTDGAILLDADGRETKRFHVRDGLGIKAAQRCGIRVGLLTARSSAATAHRAAELGIEIVHQGAGDKLAMFEKICQRLNLGPAAVAYMGDDLADLAVMRRVGYALAPADAADEIRQTARYVTERAGGRGAVREAIEHLLRASGRWAEVVASYDRCV